VTCPPLSTVAAYCLDELAETDAASIEEHFFECDACLARVLKMRALCDQLAGMLPHVLTERRRRDLEASGQPLAVMHVAPGERAALTFPPGVGVGFWVLRAPVAGAERVDLELCTHEGARIIALSDVPFDRGREEVVLACQTAYGALGLSPDVVARVVVVDPSGQQGVNEYLLDHVFESL
jgi:anti-sigma factor RsiW